MSQFLAPARDTVRTQLGPVPVAGIVVAALAGALLPRLDFHRGRGLPTRLSAVLFGGDAGAVRTPLDAIAVAGPDCDGSQIGQLEQAAQRVVHATAHRVYE